MLSAVNESFHASPRSVVVFISFVTRWIYPTRFTLDQFTVAYPTLATRPGGVLLAGLVEPGVHRLRSDLHIRTEKR